MNLEVIHEEFEKLLLAAERLTVDVDIVHMLKEGIERPLGAEEAQELLRRVVGRLERGAEARGDRESLQALRGRLDDLTAQAMAARTRIRAAAEAGTVHKTRSLELLPGHNGISRTPVSPRPVFHEKEIPMLGGFIKTTDLRLWDNNERLDLHVSQFEAKHRRGPSPDELLHIMLGEMPLEGIGQDDEFEILKLARSIAANGVRKPPILDLDGTLLDGNRRVAACYLILHDTKEFSSEEKKRAEYIYAWQLMDGATQDDRQRVIVSLNFESDQKKEWPEYIKARKVAEEWEAMLRRESIRPGPKRQAEMKRELSKKYALGPETAVVNRYLKMVEWASDFEDHHINCRNQDPFAVKHSATRYFQYFDELSKGGQPGGVAWSLEQDDTFKRTVFDLLFDDKFQNWRQIRALKHVYSTPESRDVLAKAHEEPDLERAQEFVEDAIAIANTKRAEVRSMGSNIRIETFSKWLEEVPPRTLRDEVRPENLQRLLSALQLVRPIVEQSLTAKGNGQW
jgi:hypothetical protein